MIITRLCLLLTIAHCCTAYGSNPKPHPIRSHRSVVPPAIPQSLLLCIALQRAVEQDGFDTILNKVKNDSYQLFSRVAPSILIPYAFVWEEHIDSEDESPTAQLLFDILKKEGTPHGNTKFMIKELVWFDSTGTFRANAHDHRKNEILAMLEELKPMNTKIINSILTNSNPGPL